MRHGMTLLTLGLLVGTVAAFAYTERLKLDRPPVGDVRFDRWLSPACGCPHVTARLSFELREPERIDVTVVAGDERVRVLAAGLRRPAGRVELTWDGRDEAGRVVPDGAYRVRVRLRDARRTIVIPAHVNVDTRAPRVRLLSVSPAVLASGETFEVRYRADELGTPALLVDEIVVMAPRPRRPGVQTVTWPELVDEQELAAGSYSVALVVEDRAGNRSEPTVSVPILVSLTAPEAGQPQAR